MIRLVSPASLVMICWSATILLAAWALGDPGRFDLVPLLMEREGIDSGAFGLLGALWIAAALAAYFAGDLAGRRAAPALSRRPIAGVTLERAARLTFLAHMAILLVTLGWVALTAMQLGGLGNFLFLAEAENRALRSALLDNKLFAGMRLFYAALPATGCLAAGLLAAGRSGRLSGSGRLMSRIVVATALLALLALPVVMSQRLLLLQFLLSAWILTCMIRGRIVGLGKATVAAGLFLGVWILREAVTNPTLHRPAVEIGMQKLLFYFVNDLWNSFAPLEADLARTWGVLSLNGLLFLTFTDGPVTRAMAEQLAATEAYRGGGEFSMLTAPFVDFGPFGGALFIAGAAFAFRLIWQRARGDLGWAAIHAQIGAALLFSSHSLYVTHQNCLFSILLIVLVLRVARRGPMTRRVPPPATFAPHLQGPARLVPLPGRAVRPDAGLIGFEHAA